MYMFGGWDYSSVLATVDSLVYSRRYGGFFDIINNLTVRELTEIFNVIQNKENEKTLEKALSENKNGVEVPVEDLTPDIFDLLMNN